MKVLHNTIIALAAFMVLLGMAIFLPSFEPVADTSLVDAPAQYTFNDLLDAIEWVESKGDPWAVGDDGAAVGAYQIHKIYVDDVNRIGWCDATLTYDGDLVLSAGPDYKYDDRLDSSKSRQMARTYLNHYVGIATWDKMRRPTQMERFEAMARIHNGGPRGYLKESTKAYWFAVKARMETK